jgi:hypothetical protein
MESASPSPWIVPVGGFLGAGKTTLILAAARLLAEKGLRCAAILNDQAVELVDTAYARRQGLTTSEVSGGCFCCRFSEMMDRLDDLRAANPHVIFVEPVGSCTDISATILQPLKREFHDRYRLAPLTVLVDPARALELLAAGLHQDFEFLFDNQIAEADLIVYTKSDLRAPALELNGIAPRHISAVTGEGIGEWLDEILSGTHTSGATVIDIDYDRYARAEAALGWLNWRADIRLNEPLSPPELAGPFADSLHAALTKAGARIGHIKLLDAVPGAFLKVAFTSNRGEPQVEGDLTASPAFEHDLRLNIRAALDPASLDRLFRAELAKLPGEISGEVFNCFSPPAPKPERRIRGVV